jgi:ATP-dependent RNA helicase DHX57
MSGFVVDKVICNLLLWRVLTPPKKFGQQRDTPILGMGQDEEERKEEGGRRKEKGGRRKEKGGRRKEEGGRRKEEGGRRKIVGGSGFLHRRGRSGGYIREGEEEG